MKNKRTENSLNRSKTEVKTFGELKPGDMIEGVAGPVTVVRAYDEHLPETMYLVQTDEGVTMKVSGNHLWYVETEFDKALHRRRIRESRRKLRRTLTDSHVEFLKEVVERPADGPLEISLDDLISVLDSENDWFLIDILVRTAESVGHVAEENFLDMTGKHKVTRSMRIYDARVLCGQLLALYDRKYAKSNPVLRGRVMSTQQMFDLDIDYELPTIKRG